MRSGLHFPSGSRRARKACRDLASFVPISLDNPCRSWPLVTRKRACAVDTNSIETNTDPAQMLQAAHRARARSLSCAVTVEMYLRCYCKVRPSAVLFEFDRRPRRAVRHIGKERG